MTIEFIKQTIPDIILVKPILRPDARGHFLESYRAQLYKENGIPCEFVQDNMVYSKKNVFRGMHYQKAPMAQAKLVTAVAGDILEIAIDLRKDSPSFMKKVLIELKGEKHEQLFIPEGFAHGYVVLSDEAWVHYKVSKVYSQAHEAGIRWDDEQLGLKKIISSPLLSEKDMALPYLKYVL